MKYWIYLCIETYLRKYRYDMGVRDLVQSRYEVLIPKQNKKQKIEEGFLQEKTMTKKIVLFFITTKKYLS